MKGQLIIELTATGKLTELFTCGLVGYKTLMYRDIYFDVDILLKMGVEKMVAKQQIAEKYGVSLKTVYNAIKWFNT
jgi:DNA invertase Pin-like site-specific DNA recombinase